MNTRPFKCPYCPKSFKLSSHKKEHVRIHTGEKPFKCRYCGHAFCQISNMKTHELIHTRNFQLSCYICNKKFRRKEGLQTHLMKQHSTVQRQHKNVQNHECRLNLKATLEARMGKKSTSNLSSTHLISNREIHDESTKLPNTTLMVSVKENSQNLQYSQNGVSMVQESSNLVPVIQWLPVIVGWKVKS